MPRFLSFVCLLWLYWVTIAVLGLTIVAVNGGYSSLGMKASHFCGLSCCEHRFYVCWLQQLPHRGLVALKPVGFSGTRD